MIKIVIYLSTPLYIFLGIAVLIYNADLGFKNLHTYIAFFSFSGLVYLFLRAMFVQTINTKTELSGLWFMLTSMLPIVVIVVASIKSTDQGEVWIIVTLHYLVVTLFDLILLSLQMLRVYKLSNHMNTN